MSAASNLDLVKAVYAAFGRGDIPTLLNMIDDAIEWDGVKGTEGVLPQAGIRRSRAEVGQFFSQVAGSAEFQTFEPRQFIADDNAVAVVGYYEATVKATGHRVATDWVMVFDIANGKIVKFREWSDSAQLVRAYTP